MTFTLGFIYEALSFLRAHVLNKAKLKEKTYFGGSNSKLIAPPKTIALVGTLYMLNVLCGYLLMLIVMTYNLALFLATVFGLTAGYLVFGIFKIKQKVG